MTQSIENSTYDAKSIIAVTADFFRKTPDQLRGKRRQKTLVVPRHVAMFLMHRHTNLSLFEIGAAFGGRHHTTVLYACKTVRKLLDAGNAVLARQVEIIEKDLSGIGMIGCQFVSREAFQQKPA